jgi:ABC-type multidrug transport system permease subunit
MALMGVVAKTPEAVNNWGFMIILPLTFASTVFVRAETMPAPLETFANINPVSLVADASRGLMLGGEVRDPIIWSFVAMLVVVAVFAPLTVAKYRRRV